MYHQGPNIILPTYAFTDEAKNLYQSDPDNFKKTHGDMFVLGFTIGVHIME